MRINTKISATLAAQRSVASALAFLLLVLTLPFSGASAAQTVSSVDSAVIDVKLPDGLHVKGKLSGAFFVKGALYFQMSLPELYVAGFTDKSGKYHYYSHLQERFGAELPPPELTQGRFKIDLDVRSSLFGSQCYPMYWKVAYDLNVSLARKTKLNDDLVGTLMGEYTEARRESTGKPASKDEYKNAVRCLRNGSKSIEITSLALHDAYFPKPKSLTRLGSHIAALLDKEASREAARQAAAGQPNAPLTVKRNKPSGSDKQKPDEKQKTAKSTQKKQSNKSANYEANRAAIELQIAYDRAMDKARQAEIRGDKQAALRAYEEAYRSKPTLQARSRMSELRGSIALSNVAGSLVAGFFAEREAEEQRRLQEYRDNWKQEKRDIAEYRAEWRRSREAIAAHGRVIGFMLTGDPRYKEKSLSASVPSLAAIRQEQIQFSPSTVIGNQAALPAERRAGQLHVIALRSEERGFVSNLAASMRSFRSSESLAALKSSMPLPTMKLYVSNSMAFPVDALVEIGPDKVEDVLRTALTERYEFPPGETVLVASTDKAIVEAIRAQAVEVKADNIVVSQPRIYASVVNLKRLAKQGMSVEAALQDLSSGHTLRIGKERFIYFWDDKYISVDGDAVLPSSRLLQHMWRNWRKDPTGERIMPLSFMLEGQLFSPDFGWLNTHRKSSASPPWNLLPMAYVSRDYVAVLGNPIDEDRGYRSCLWFPNAGYRVHAGMWEMGRNQSIRLKPTNAGLITPCHAAALEKQFWSEKVEFRLPHRKVRSSFMNPKAVVRLYRRADEFSAPYFSFREARCLGGKPCLLSEAKKVTLYRKTSQTFDWQYQDLEQRAKAPLKAFYKDVASAWRGWNSAMRRDVIGKTTIPRRIVTAVGSRIALGNPLLLNKRVKLDAGTMDYHQQMVGFYQAMQAGKLHKLTLGERELEIAIE